MAQRRRQVRLYDDELAVATAVSAVLCMARCKAYADGARNKRQDALAEVYEGFEILLQEFSEDLASGASGRILIDPITFL